MGRHDFDAVSFVFGLLFTAAGLLLLGGGAVRDGLVLPWAGPIVAIGLGVVIAIAARPRGAARVVAPGGPADPTGPGSDVPPATAGPGSEHVG